MMNNNNNISNKNEILSLNNIDVINGNGVIFGIVQKDNNNNDNIQEQLISKNIIYKKNNITNNNKKKKWICIFFLILFCISSILCFFYIPRVPNVILKNINIDNNNKTNYSISGLFIFENYNYYNIEWNDLEISLYWIPYKGQNIGEICYNNGNLCNYNIVDKYICAIKLGIFEEKEEFKTLKKSIIQKKIYVKPLSNQEEACCLWMILNPYQNKPQQLISKGHINYKDIYSENNKIHIQTNYYYLTF